MLSPPSNRAGLITICGRRVAAIFAISFLYGCDSGPSPKDRSNHFEESQASGAQSLDRVRLAFREVGEAVGLHFTHFNGATEEAFLPEIMGSGVALFDYDNDGDLDIYLVQSTRINDVTPLRFPETDVKGSGKLFRNSLIPNGTLGFEDVTERAGLLVDGYGRVRKKMAPMP